MKDVYERLKEIILEKDKNKQQELIDEFMDTLGLDYEEVLDDIIIKKLEFSTHGIYGTREVLYDLERLEKELQENAVDFEWEQLDTRRFRVWWT